MLKPYLERAMEGNSLNVSEMKEALHLIFEGASTAESSALLTALRIKGESEDEIFSAVEVLKEKMLQLDYKEPLLDIVGTGGDGQNSVNISTAAAIVAASAGAKVAKHGNRASSSRSGSADVLEAMGIELMKSAEEVADELDHLGISFLFAPAFHPAMKTISPLRKQLGIRTLFNLLGPLLHPYSAKHLVVGVSHEKYLDPFARVLQKMGITHALVVFGDPLDELSCVGPSQVREVTQESILQCNVDPTSFGFPLCSLSDLRGGDARENAERIEKALKSGKGPLAQSIALNAGAGLYVYGSASSLEEGVEIAIEAMQSGRAHKKLNEWRSYERS